MGMTCGSYLARSSTKLSRLCLFGAGGGAIEADEYGQGMGFGFSWEFPAPRPVHALLTVFSRRWLSRQRDPSALLPDVITRPQRMRAVLAWFAHCPLPARSWPLEPATVRELTRTNRPGRGQPGTANWRWHGRQFLHPVHRWRGRRCSCVRSPCRPPMPSRCQRQLRCGKRWRLSRCCAHRRSQPCRAHRRRMIPLLPRNDPCSCSVCSRFEKGSHDGMCCSDQHDSRVSAWLSNQVWGRIL